MNFNFDILQQPYHRDNWKDLIRTLFPSESDLFATPTTFDLGSDRIESFVQFGNIELNDRYNSRLALFEVQLKPGTTKLQINRVALREIAEKMRRDTAITGAFAVFADAATGKWRFTFIAKAAVFGEKIVETADNKRYTYVFGKGETTKTAEARFNGLAGIVNKRLEDILEAFSVEKVSDEFFKAYKNLYEQFCDDMYRSAEAQNIFGNGDNAQKNQRDFIKRMMGRITFLYFIQKKGWLGVKQAQIGYKDGNPHFMPNLFERTPDKSRFYAHVLAPLFFDTLNKDNRENDLFILPNGEHVKVPFLNGGLFERDFEGSEHLNFPAELFEALFATFDQYNFTIDESSPDDHEVGIDPEMLGIVFENLLEDNKDKGTFYTPKVVVHYMCQESLIQYLCTHLQPQKTEKADLFSFVRRKNSESAYISSRKGDLIKLLKEVKICDPAIGSGAFPMGMLHEIFYCILELDTKSSHYELKQHIIQNSIYGVDFEKGAVDIARLRFWLSLVVNAELKDDEKPEPLPNLDYKIMQGDSLLERFKDIPLDKIGRDFEIKVFEPGDLSILNEPELTYGGLQYKTDIQQSNLKIKIRKFFNPMSFDEKLKLQREIDEEIHEIIKHNFERQKKKPLEEIKRDEVFYSSIKESPSDSPANRDKKEKSRASLLRKIQGNQKAMVELEIKMTELESLMAKPDQKHYFLWHAYFQDVLDNGGFDIIIANPPYIQLQKYGEKTNDYENAGFKSFARMGDIYCLFYEQGIRLLREGGILTYITSNKWMRADYGKPLRRLLADKVQVLHLIDFGSVQVFKTATVDTNILVARKAPPLSDIKACRFSLDYQFGTDLDAHIKAHEITMPMPDAETVWTVSDKETFDLKQAIENAGIPLKDWKVTVKDANGNNVETEALKLNYGIKTGYNKAFIIPETEKNDLLKKVATAGGSLSQYEVLFKPILEGKHIKKFRAEWEHLWVIFIPWHFPLHENENINGASIIAEKEFESQYPILYNYFNSHKNELSNRNKAETGIRYEWYALQRCAASYYQEFKNPKLIWGNLNVNATFTVDTEGMFINAPANMLTSLRDDIKYLGAVLNSRVTSFMMRQIAYSREHGYLEYKKVFVEQMPVPELSPERQQPFAILVDYLLFLYDSSKPKAHPHASNEMLAVSFENFMNMAVFELYFEQHMKEKEVDVLQFFDLPDLTNLSDDIEKARVIKEQYDRLEAYENPVRNRVILANLHSKMIQKINSLTL
jgi:hypothetical protein